MGIILEKYYDSVRGKDGYIDHTYSVRLDHHFELPEEITRYSSYKFFNTKKRDLVMKMMDWCDDNINGIYDVMMDSILFQFETDAMAFKLRWL